MIDYILRGALILAYVGLVFTSTSKPQRIVSTIAIATSAIIEVATR